MGISFRVIGTPAPQGSKRFIGRGGGRGRMIESSKAVAPWRQDVVAAAVAVRGTAPPMDGPVSLTVHFYLKAPASVSRRKLAMGPFRKPDLSKLVRSTEDALVTAGVIADDARIVLLAAHKSYCDVLDPEQGAYIVIEEMECKPF